MAARLSPLLPAAALVLLVLSGCHRDEPAADRPVQVEGSPGPAPASGPASAPDPAAPAPGTQAAEAIGADSAADGERR
jgi:hypothetical protein